MDYSEGYAKQLISHHSWPWLLAIKLSSNYGGTLVWSNIMPSSIKSTITACIYSFNSTAVSLDLATLCVWERVWGSFKSPGYCFCPNCSSQCFLLSPYSLDYCGLPPSLMLNSPHVKLPLRDDDWSSLENRQLESWRRLFICHRPCCKMPLYVFPGHTETGYIA